MDKYDIIIIGSGPAGVAAAIQAARNKAKVLLIEKSGVLGGMCTAGLLNCWCGSARSRIMKEIKEAGQDICPEESLGDEQRYYPYRHVYDPEILKSFFLDTALNAGVQVLFHTTFCEVEKEQNRVKYVQVLTREGFRAFNASVFIDATGDGDLSIMAGVHYLSGDENGTYQPMSTMLMVGGVDEKRAVYKPSPDLMDRMKEFQGSGKLTEPAGHIILVPGFNRGTASVNMTNAIRLDGTNSEDLNSAEIQTQKQIPEIIEFLRKYVPGFSECYLISRGQYVGVRETRHLIGDYTLTAVDISEGKTFDDWLVQKAHYHFGNHSTDGANRNPDTSLSFGSSTYTIPARSFYNSLVPNLLFAGRCISGTPEASASFRVMPICFAMGEGVGQLAAEAAELSIDVNKVDITKVQKKLLKVQL